MRSKRKDWLPLLIWPAIGFIAIALLWANTVMRVGKDEEAAEAAIRSQVLATSESYALQLEHTLQQIDQITLRLKFAWEDPDTPLDLEKERQYGLFPESELLYANIFDAKGDLVTSTLLDRRPTNVAAQPYFQAHQKECCIGLLISSTSRSLLLDRPVVRFTRRLNAPDGSFNGVVFVSVEPPYLVAFQHSAASARNDFVAVRLASGPLLAGREGNGKTELRGFYRNEPAFPSSSGVTLEPGETFRDGHARFVAWKRLEDYPVVAITGVSAKEALAPYEQQANRYRETAGQESLLLMALACAAGYFTARYASRRRQAEEIRETYRLATNAANEGFYMIRPVYDGKAEAQDFRLEDCNDRAAELVGASRQQLIGIKASELQPKEYRDETLALCRLALEKGLLEEELRVPSHSPIRAKWVYRRIMRSSAGLALTLRDISEAKEHEQALSDLANYDTLTQLPNRNWINRFLPDAVRHASSSTGHLAVFFIDLDNFKYVNDTLGHDAGDELLVQAAKRLKGATRASDHVARLGGDEFVIFLEHIEVVEDVSRVAKAVINTISKPFSLAAGTGSDVTASIGISLFPDDGTNAETLLKHADIAMYAAKAAGKGRYAFYQSHLSDSLILRLNKERALRDAVERDEFVMHYQPRVGTDSGQLVSMEALVRWEHPKLGLTYPSDFIDIAEDIGLIVRIGELVIEKVCRQLADWKEKGLPIVPISCNVSPLQLKSGSLSAFIASCMRRYGIEPSLIEVELTESAVIERSLTVTEELAALRALGVKLMIDDFGTGYSSMAQLHRLDVDALKVDKAFTKGLCDGGEGELLFGAIMSMANALDIAVVAEGVETAEQRRLLQTLSCGEIQGYLVSKGVAAEEAVPLLLKRYLLSPQRIPGRFAPA